VGFSRTDDGHNHRQGATSCTEPGHSSQRAVKSSHGLGCPWYNLGRDLRVGTSAVVSPVCVFYCITTTLPSPIRNSKLARGRRQRSSCESVGRSRYSTTRLDEPLDAARNLTRDRVSDREESEAGPSIRLGHQIDRRARAAAAAPKIRHKFY